MLQLILLFLLFQMASNTDPVSGILSYPTFTEAKEHFLNSIGTFTVMEPVDPNMAARDFLSKTTLSAQDKSFLRYFIYNYITFHKQNRYNSTRRLIFTPLRTGIGDRMGCLMFAYWAAVLSKRVFLVDWHYPFPLHEFLTEANGLQIFLQEGQIQREAKVGKLAILTNKLSSVDTYEAVLGSDANTVIMATNRLPKPFSESELKKLLPGDLSPRFVNKMRLNRNFHRAILHHVLRLSDEMRRAQATLNSRMGISGESADERRGVLSDKNWLVKPFVRPKRPYIAVHARIGAGVGENGTNRFKNISENAKLAAGCLASRAVRLSFLAGSPALPVYLATDTPKFKDIFEKVVYSYSNGRIDVVSGNWSVQHSNKLVANVNKKSRKRDWAAMWGAYMDLVMLGHGEHILALYSSFPRLALAIGNAETLTELRNHICLSS